MLAFFDELNPILHVGSGISHNTHLALKLRYWHYLATRRGPDISSHGSKPLFQQLDCNRDAPLSNRLALVSTNERSSKKEIVLLDLLFSIQFLNAKVRQGGNPSRRPHTLTPRQGEQRDQIRSRFKRSHGCWTLHISFLPFSLQVRVWYRLASFFAST